MFVLQIIAGPYKGQAVQLVMDQPLTVGRSPSCNVRLEDVHMSGAHAEVMWNADGFSVFDLNSANGTLVNGKKTQGRTPVRLGDHIQTGGVIFHLRDVDIQVEGDIEMIEVSDGPRMLAFDAGKTEVAMRAMIPVAQTMAVGALPKGGAPDPLDRAATVVPKTLGDRAQKTTMAAGVAAPHLDAEVLSGAAALKQRVEAGGSGATALVQWEDRIDPFWSAPVSIGREHSSGIVLEDSAVSLRHAVIDVRDGRYLLRDVGSSNGVFINQKRIVEQELSDGDIISIGAHTMLVVLGTCLGLSIQPPSLLKEKARADLNALGIVDQPLAADGGKKKKKRKKASELVWYATSDLDRGGFRARAAFVATVLGIGLTGWMLASGDSEILAGSRLAEHHENDEFLTKAESNGLDRCTACHVGAGRVSTLKCLDCHPYNRPTTGHTAGDVGCVACHYEHRGNDFAAAADAAYSCGACHPEPHLKLARTSPKLVAAFDRNAPGDVEFHTKHTAEDVTCLKCHEYEAEADPEAIRAACGQCHAPEHPAAEDCQMCHTGHPDRDKPPHFTAVPPAAPPRFALKGLVWTFALLVLSFLLAAMIPRRRKVAIEAAEAEV